MQYHFFPLIYNNFPLSEQSREQVPKKWEPIIPVTYSVSKNISIQTTLSLTASTVF